MTIHWKTVEQYFTVLLFLLTNVLLMTNQKMLHSLAVLYAGGIKDVLVSVQDTGFAFSSRYSASFYADNIQVTWSCDFRLRCGDSLRIG